MARDPAPGGGPRAPPDPGPAVPAPHQTPGPADAMEGSDGLGCRAHDRDNRGRPARPERQ